MISPVMAAFLRRYWQVVASLLVLLVFTLVHALVFQPMAKRFELAVRRAGDLGLVIEPERPTAAIPPRVLALLIDNMLPLSAGGMERESGALTAALLEDVTQLTNKHGMRVLATEPGLVVQEAKGIQVRARLRIQCSFAQYLAFVDDMSRSRRLIAIDRFEFIAGAPDRHQLEIWITRYILKEPESRRGA